MGEREPERCVEYLSRLFGEALQPKSSPSNAITIMHAMLSILHMPSLYLTKSGRDHTYTLYEQVFINVLAMLQKYILSAGVEFYGGGFSRIIRNKNTKILDNPQ